MRRGTKGERENRQRQYELEGNRERIIERENRERKKERGEEEREVCV